MRIKILFLLFFTSLHGFSQDWSTGFYQVVNEKDGKRIKVADSGTMLTLAGYPFLELNDIKDITLDVRGKGNLNAILFELTPIGAEKLKVLTANNTAVQMALVVDGKLLHTDTIRKPISKDALVFRGFDGKKSKSVFTTLEVALGRIPLFAKEFFLIYTDRALYNGEERYNSRTDHDDFIRREVTSDGECSHFYQSYYHPLSLVGNFYSYEYGEAAESACGPMGSTLGVKTVDIATGKTVSILELVKEDDFVAAFKNDSWVIERARAFNISAETIKSFSDVFTFLNTDSGILFTESSFCILGFSEGNLKIRFVGREYMGYNHSRHLQLGFELPLKKEAFSFFKDDSNFYMGTFKNGLTSY